MLRTLRSAVRVLLGDKSLRVTWVDGTEANFHYAWLRDHSPQSLHQSGQRQYDTLQMKRNIKPLRADIVANSNLAIEWEPDNSGERHQSSFSLRWLKENSYSNTARAARLAHMPPRKLWNRCLADSLPMIPFSTYHTADGFKQAVSALLTYGLVFIQGVPSTEEATRGLAEKLGTIRRTFYGDGIWDTLPRTTKVIDTAYTTQELKPHIDGCYFTEPPGLQVFNCVMQAKIGGDSWFCDGFHVAKVLQENNPAAYKFFSTRRIPFQHYSAADQVFMKASSPVFVHDHNGVLQQFVYNNDDRAPLTDLSEEDVELFYEYVPDLLAATRSNELALNYKLRVGDTVIVNNFRVLHGRRAFQGPRNLVGCYMNYEELLSSARCVGLLED